MAVVVKTNGIPFWLVGEFTTQFRTYFSGYEILIHSHMFFFLAE